MPNQIAYTRVPSKSYTLEIPKILTGVTVITMGLITGLSYCFGYIKGEETIKVLKLYGVTSILITILWTTLKSILWRASLFQWEPIRKTLRIPPDIRGRWEGTLDRAGESRPHKFVIEIAQNLLEVKVATFSEKNQSTSLIATIGSDTMEDDFFACYLWQGTGTHLPDHDYPVGLFNGFTTLMLIENNEGRCLRGQYFSNRVPKQTMGQIELKFVSLKRKNQV